VDDQVAGRVVEQADGLADPVQVVVESDRMPINAVLLALIITERACAFVRAGVLTGPPDFLNI